MTTTKGPAPTTSGSAREPSPIDDRAERWVLVHEKLHELRGHYQRARARGQVEVHLGLDAFDFLLTLAQPTVNAGLERARLKPAGVTVRKRVPRG
jgi:hypothetical protein